MIIQVNGDHTMPIDESLTRFVEGEVNHHLATFLRKLTRVEVHLSDVDSGKHGGADKRCVLEARPAGGQPVSVSASGTRLASAVGQALEKMKRALTTHFDKLAATKHGAAS